MRLLLFLPVHRKKNWCTGGLEDGRYAQNMIVICCDFCSRRKASRCSWIRADTDDRVRREQSEKFREGFPLNRPSLAHSA